MKHSLNIYLELLKKGREKRRRMISILLVLSFVVTGAVAWNLRLNGVTATVEAFCGYEEHTHTESCTLEEVLACDGTTGHVHSVADCFAFENVLSCVSEEHVHGEDCYNALGESICFKSVHTHSDACYTKEAVLVCEIAEGEHVHTEACYKEKWSCGFVEHVHAAECFADTEADVETAEVWEATLPELSGYWAEDTASIALSQVGYAESDVNFILGDNNEKKYYSRYGEWFGNKYGDWNVIFAEFCLYYAGVTNDYIPMSAGANSWQIKLEKQPYYFTNETKAEGYVPAGGSIIFIDLNADGAADKVAVITGVADGFYNTVEGDLNGVVGETMYAVDSELVIGYLDTTLVAAAYGEGAVSEEVLAEESVQTFLSDFSADTTVNFKYMSYLEKYDFIKDDIEGTYILSGIIDTTAANNGGSPKLPTNATARAGTLKTLALPLRQVRTAGLFTNNDIDVTAGDDTAENFYYYELGTKIELDELYTANSGVHLWSGTSVSTNDKLGTNDYYDLTAIWVQKTKDLKLPSESATTDATSKNWKDWTVYCLDDYYQETDVQVSMINVAEGKPVKIESADGSSFSAITYLTAWPDYVLRPVTSVTAGNDYVFVNKKTGKVLTNTVENGGHWYFTEGQNHILLGNAPTVNSPVWTVETDSSGNYAIKCSGGYLNLSPNTVNAGLVTGFRAVSIEYDTTEKAFQIYRTSGDAKYKLVACHDGNGNYIYAIGCQNSDFDAYSYWEIYETVEYTQTVAEAISTHNQTAVTSYLDKYGVLTNGFSSIDYEKAGYNSSVDGQITANNSGFDFVKINDPGSSTSDDDNPLTNNVYFIVDLIDTYENISYVTFDVANSDSSLLADSNFSTTAAKDAAEAIRDKKEDFELVSVEISDNGETWTVVSDWQQDNPGGEEYKRDRINSRFAYVFPTVQSARYIRLTVGDNHADGATVGGVAVGEIKVYSTEIDRVNYALNTAKFSVKSADATVNRVDYAGVDHSISRLEVDEGGSYERANMIDAPYLFDNYTALNTAHSEMHDYLKKDRYLQATVTDSTGATIEVDLTQEAKNINEVVIYSANQINNYGSITVESTGAWDSNVNMMSEVSADRMDAHPATITERVLWDGVATKYVYFIDFTTPISSAAILRINFGASNKTIKFSEIKVYGDASNELNYALGRYVYLYNTGTVSSGFTGDSTQANTNYSGAHFGVRYNDSAFQKYWAAQNNYNHYIAAHTFHTSNYTLTNGLNRIYDSEGNSIIDGYGKYDYIIANLDNSSNEETELVTGVTGTVACSKSVTVFDGAFNKNRMVFVVDLDGKKNGITKVTLMVQRSNKGTIEDTEFNIRSVQTGMDPDGNYKRGWLNGTTMSTYPTLLTNLTWSDVANGQLSIEQVSGEWYELTYTFTSTEAEYIKIEGYSENRILISEIEVIGSPWVNAAANKSVDISVTKNDLVTPQPVNITACKAEGTTWTDTKVDAKYSVSGVGTPGEFDLDKNVLTDGRVPLFGLDDAVMLTNAPDSTARVTLELDLGQVRNVAQVEVYAGNDNADTGSATSLVGDYKLEKVQVSIDGKNWTEAQILSSGKQKEGGSYTNASNNNTQLENRCFVTKNYAVLTEDYEARYIRITGRINDGSSAGENGFCSMMHEVKVNCIPIYENSIEGYYNGVEGHVIPVDTINDLKSIEFLGDGSQFEYENGSDTNVAPIYDSNDKVDKVYVGNDYTVIYIYTPLDGTFTTEGDMYDYRITAYDWYSAYTPSETKHTLTSLGVTSGASVPLSNVSPLYFQTAFNTVYGWRGVYGINSNYNFFTTTDGETFPAAVHDYYTVATKEGAAAANGTNSKARIHFGNENNSIGNNSNQSGLSWIKWDDNGTTVLPNLSNSKLMPDGKADYVYQQGAYGLAASTLSYKNEADGYEYQLNFNPAFDSIDLFNGMYGKTPLELAEARRSDAGGVMGKIAYDYEMEYVRSGDKLTLSKVTGTDQFSNGQYAGLPGGANGTASGSDNLQYLSYVYYKQNTDTFAAMPTNNLFPLDDVYFVDRIFERKDIGTKKDVDGIGIQYTFGKSASTTDTAIIATERKTGNERVDSLSGNSSKYGTYYENTASTSSHALMYLVNGTKNLTVYSSETGTGTLGTLTYGPSSTLTWNNSLMNEVFVFGVSSDGTRGKIRYRKSDGTTVNGWVPLADATSLLFSDDYIGTYEVVYVQYGTTMFSSLADAANKTNTKYTMERQMLKLGEVTYGGVKYTKLLTHYKGSLAVYYTAKTSGFTSYGNLTSKAGGVTVGGKTTNSTHANMIESDDFFAHNHFFGMHDELTFTIPEDYCGPLEFFFYGDDDMWVYLDGQLICDIGGVHQAIAQYVNLWDYIDTGSTYSTLARATGSEEHTLSIFYTERGAYGSTCYVSFTLPVASTAPRAIGVSKEAVRINNAVVEDVYDDDFSFEVSFYDVDQAEITGNTSVELTYHKTLVNGEVQEVSVTQVPFTVDLKSGENFIMQNLPEDYAFFSVVETGATGSRIKGQDGNYVESDANHITYYTTDIEATGGLVNTETRTATLVPIDEYNLATARFTNIPAVSEMPETGGGGIMWFMLIGFALTVIPMGAGIFSTVKKAKRFLAK